MTRKASIADRNAADAQALAAWLRTQNYLAVRVLPDGSVAALAELLFTRGIVLGCHWDGWANRFCFGDRELANRRFMALQSEDDEPDGHVARQFGVAARDTKDLG